MNICKSLTMAALMFNAGTEWNDYRVNSNWLFIVMNVKHYLPKVDL